MQLSEIWIYPIKSLGGIRVASATVLPKGLEYDRRYMLVDANGVAITQRDEPQLALFRLKLSPETILIQFQQDDLSIATVPTAHRDSLKVQIWNDQVTAHEPDRGASDWFSEKLGVSCKLVYFPESNSRPVDSQYAINDDQVSLADAYPLLLIGQSSLDDLNTRLAQPVPMDRFRPNVVVTGTQAYAEDQWGDFRIGSAVFTAVKPCARCAVPTIDQHTGVRGTEPIRTLSSYRTVKNKVYFGQNLLVKSGHEIKVGDPVSIDSYR